MASAGGSARSRRHSGLGGTRAPDRRRRSECTRCVRVQSGDESLAAAFVTAHLRYGRFRSLDRNASVALGGVAWSELRPGHKSLVDAPALAAARAEYACRRVDGAI